jgi:hypothetical protein
MFLGSLGGRHGRRKQVWRAGLATTNELKEVPAALIVRLPSWRACRDSNRQTDNEFSLTRCHRLARSTEYQPFKPHFGWEF